MVGGGVGVRVGWGGVGAVGGACVDGVAVPYAGGCGYLLVSGLFGMLAAILPARRASKLNVLDAISHE